MLGPEDFVVIVVVLVAFAALGVLLVGFLHRRQASTPPPGKTRRDVIAEGAMSREAVDELLEAENARLRARGRDELSRRELEARLVGNRGLRERLLRLRMRRHPERARPLA